MKRKAWKKPTGVQLELWAQVYNTYHVEHLQQTVAESDASASFEDIEASVSRRHGAAIRQKLALDLKRQGCPQDHIASESQRIARAARKRRLPERSQRKTNVIQSQVNRKTK